MTRASFTKVNSVYDEYDTCEHQGTEAKVHPREVVQAFKELEAIQPPLAFVEYPAVRVVW